MDFLNDGDGRKISVEKWIEHWSRCYEQVYDDFDEYFENMNFSTGSLDNQNLAALCKWKDRQYWERLKKVLMHWVYPRSTTCGIHPQMM
jgi:hypothetical protein